MLNRICTVMTSTLVIKKPTITLVVWHYQEKTFICTVDDNLLSRWLLLL